MTEAAQLQADLRRAGIEPFAWVINASMVTSGATDPLLRMRMRHELEQIARVRRDYATRVAIVPWAPDSPVGPEKLRALAQH